MFKTMIIDTNVLVLLISIQGGLKFIQYVRSFREMSHVTNIAHDILFKLYLTRKTSFRLKMYFTRVS